MREREVNPIEGTPDETLTSDEETLWSSQSSHWHCTPHHIQFLGSDEEAHDTVQEAYDEGVFDSGPCQVTVRNRQGRPIRVLSDWDGYQLHLDVASTEEPTLSPTAALAATWRYLVQRYGGWLLAILLVVLLSLTSGAIWVLFSGLM